MTVLPITDSKTQLLWINQRNKTQKQHDEAFMNIKDGIAFITDFSSPADNNQSSKTNSEKPAKKIRRLSYTSENWIG